MSESSRQALELTRQRQLRQEYTKFFKTEDGRSFVREFGRSIPCARTRPHSTESALDFCDPADLPQASVTDHPLEHLEPQRHSTELDGLSYEDVKSASAIFEGATRWCLDGRDLVDKGLRSSAMISALHPNMYPGLKIDERYARAFLAAKAGTNGAFELCGQLFGPVLEWLRRGDKVSELGERIMVLFYVLRPDLIGDSTLAELGRISNKTRQAKDKLANCLRDTYSGIKARAMRGDITRTRCRQSQRAVT